MTLIRSRISAKANRARVALQLKRAVAPLGVYLVGLLLAAASFAYIAFQLPGGAGLAASRTVSFAVPDATGIVSKRAEVRFRGIPVGVVTKTVLKNGSAVLTADMNPEYGKIYRDAHIAVRPNTPLQDMYIDILERGTPVAGRVTATVPLAASRVDSSVNVSDVLNVFDADTRTRLSTTLAEFGRGIDDRGLALREIFRTVAPFLTLSKRLASQVAERELRVRRLAHNSAVLTEELGRRETEIRRLLGDGSSVLQTLRASSTQLDQTLAELPPTMRALDSSFAAVRGVLPDVDNALVKLDPVAKALPGALGSVRDLSDAARPALTALQPSVRALDPLSKALVPFSAQASAAASALRPQIGALNHVTSSVAKCTFPIQRFFQWTQSTFGFGDARGEAPRGDAALGLDVTGVLKDPRISEAPACAGGTQSNGVQKRLEP